VQWASEETLDLPTLDVVDVGTCSGTPTAEQSSLFGNRNNAFASDVVIYFVLATNPAFNGCATHPSDKPGAVVAQIASQWTMAHEIGHVLGLSHITGENAPSCTTPDFTRLMTGCGTSNITVALPKLVASEQTTMDASPYAHTLAN